MNIYFTTSARGTKKYGSYYSKIYTAIKQLGHTHTDDYTRDSDAKRVYNGDFEYKKAIYNEAIKCIKKSEVAVFEGSVHSLTIGFLIREALSFNKSVIVLHLPGMAPAFAEGILEEKFQLVEYDETNIKRVLKNSLEYADKMKAVRFNFFISPKINTFLDWAAKKNDLSKSEYLRNLIFADMDKYPDFLSNL